MSGRVRLCSIDVGGRQYTEAMNSGKTSSLSEVRFAIDEIDQQLVALIAERQKWVLMAGALKNDEDGVRSPARIEQVIGKVRALADSAGASPDVVEHTYRAMIGAFIDLELAHHRSNQ